MWVAFLRIMREYLPAEVLKYKNVDQFLASYTDRQFSKKYSEHEQINLMNTANWMTILFQMEKAKKNKGLAMDVIPKLVEGPSARYVTGSGQTVATADRVHIYEVEGNIEPMSRGRRRKAAVKPVAAPKHARVGPKVHKKRKITAPLPTAYALQNAPVAAGQVMTYMPLGRPTYDHTASSATHDKSDLSSSSNGEPSTPTLDMPANKEFVTFSVDLSRFKALTPAVDRDSAAAADSGRTQSSLAMDLTDNTDDSEIETTSVFSAPGTELDLSKDELMLEEDLHDYWDYLGGDSSSSDIKDRGFVRFPTDYAPPLLRQPTDRPELLALLGEVGGPENPVSLDADLNPGVFSSASGMSPPTNGKTAKPKKRPRTGSSNGSPELSRVVSWGGHRVMNNAPAFPAPHVSYHNAGADVMPPELSDDFSAFN